MKCGDRSGTFLKGEQYPELTFDDLAGAIVVFTSGAASFIAGQVVNVSGGLTMNG